MSRHAMAMPFSLQGLESATANFQRAALITWQSKPGCRRCSFAALAGSLGIWLLSCLLILMLVESMAGHHFEVTFTQETFLSETIKQCKTFSLLTNALICSVYSSFLLAVSRIPRCWKSPSFACLSFYNVHFKYQFWKSGFCDVTSGILVSDRPLSGS